MPSSEDVELLSLVDSSWDWRRFHRLRRRDSFRLAMGQDLVCVKKKHLGCQYISIANNCFACHKILNIISRAIEQQQQKPTT